MASYRPITTEISAPTTSGTATTVSGADIVRVVNTATSSQLVTLLDDSDIVLGSMTLVGGQTEFIKKREGDKIYAASSDVLLTRTTYPTT